MLPTYRPSIEFSDVSSSDPALLDTLDTLPEVHWLLRHGVLVASKSIEAPSAEIAAQRLIQAVEARVPGAQATRAYRDLVTISDVAARVGVSRQAVQNWVARSRRSSAEFPAPMSVVGDAVRVWEWSTVNKWLHETLALGDGHNHPTSIEMSSIDLMIAAMRRPAARISTAGITDMINVPVASTAAAWVEFAHRQTRVDSPYNNQFSLAA